MKASERRFTARYDLKVPLRFQPLDQPQVPPQFAESINVSARGIMFFSKVQLTVGVPLRINFKMPAEVSGRHSMEWDCRCRVVRVEPADETSGVAGIGAEIQYYDIVRDADPGHQTNWSVT